MFQHSSELSSISNDLKKISSDTELKNKIDKGLTENFNHANNIQRRQYVFRVPASLETNTKESKRYHIHHIGDYIQRPDLTNNSISVCFCCNLIGAGNLDLLKCVLAQSEIFFYRF